MNKKIGQYEVLSLLGKGGMGEVYRARDTQLQRDVALKLLPEGFASDPERLARLQREAQILASLNHPNIAQIYGLEGTGASRCIVMEWVDGETLQERIQRGPIPIEDALSIARQVAEALEAAHEKHVIHRDLKPANVKITPDGKVKVLDFGLAKAATNAGVILGTAAYMSPEQAKGFNADQRTDIFAFGSVLYEMISGHRAFDGDTVSEILASVLKSQPDFTLLPSDLDPRLLALLRRCLEKHPRRRWYAAGDVRVEIETILASPSAAVGAGGQALENQPLWKQARLAAVGMLIGVAVAGGGAWWTLRPSNPVVRLVVPTPDPFAVVGNTTLSPDIAISPDGRRLVYAVGDPNQNSDPGLYVRNLDQLDAFPLRGIGGRASSPFISPGGNSIGFFESNTLKKTAINGGPAVTVCKVTGVPRGASWGAGDDIVFSTNARDTGLLRVAAGGGEPEVLTRPDAQKNELDHLFPEILPGGRAVLFTIIFRGSPIENSVIAVLDLKTQEQKILIRGGSNAHYASTGHIVYGVAGTLRAVPFDLDRLEVRGDPVAVVEHVMMKVNGATNFSIADNGSLVYAAGESPASGAERTLVWVDRQGHEEPVGVPARAYAYPRISHDGTRLALDIRDQDNDAWIWNFARRTLTRLTFDSGFNRGVAWSPDSRRLAFSAQPDGPENIYWQASDGTGSAERLTQDEAVQVPASFSPDGKKLLFITPDTSPYDIGVVNIQGDHHAEVLFHTPYSELNPEISPDGKWLAYESDESGRTEVYVRPFPDIDSGRWQVSVGGGTRPAWARNGSELFYYAPPGKMMVVPIETGSTFAAATPQVLFEGQYLSLNSGRTYDVSRDGQRFLMIKDAYSGNAAASLRPQLVVVLNWLEELKRLTSE